MQPENEEEENFITVRDSQGNLVRRKLVDDEDKVKMRALGEQRIHYPEFDISVVDQAEIE